MIDNLFSEIELNDCQRQGIHQLESDMKYGDPDFEWKSTCFLISWLREELTVAGKLDETVLAVLGDDIDGRMPFLQEMLSGQGEKFHEFRRRVAPYLIYVPDGTCFGALQAFAYQFGEALKRAGYEVVYAGKDEITPDFVNSLVGRTFRGIIGFQNMSFGLRLSDGRYLYDLIDAPVYDMVFDHPCWYGDTFAGMPQQVEFLCVDRYYAAYIDKYLHHRAVFFPPAGEKTDLCDMSFAEFRNAKQSLITYPVSFMGTCTDSLDEDLSVIHEQQPTLYPLACIYVQKMMQEVRKPQDVVLHELLSDPDVMRRYFGRDDFFSDEEFVRFCKSWAFLGRDVVQHLRKKVILAILDAGVELHVFSDSFRIFEKYPNLHIHPGVDYNDVEQVYRQSLISLNVMTGHKAGFTERVADIMLGGALCFTEGTEYIDEAFTDGENIATFRLTDEDIAAIPARINELLSDQDRTLEIAYNGMKKAAEEHTWDRRADKFERLYMVN